ncbi:hypothetical protein DDA10_20765 [Clostridioides difficile]|uniref:hypothetical protein n=1 Tax=Clostridioides difficile TaxID=1496 RepID=UPI0013734DBA|nr:hypothetical protein [Clostridioides difficile]MDB3611990.1 hypothetical protein [Clostridioides difficile]NAT21306.1 hypothetical protein [Clostridioides difficile]NAT70782.1 hypothetical protein [Clostridioides difficile]HBG7052721.1 hypothetical protein [Clostridioides difficile]
MIKVILCSTIDEYMEYEDVIGAKDSYLMDVIIGGECSEIDAIETLEILKNSKARVISEAEKTLEIGKQIVKGIEQGIKEGSKLKRRICCDNCGASVGSSEELTSMPILENYNNNRSVSDQLGSIDVCPDCLLEITDLL